jgi:hypothetical protein
MGAWRGSAGALLLGLCVGAAMMWQSLHHVAPTEPATVWVDRIREVARLEMLDVELHKKIDFAPDPSRLEGSWRDVMAWAVDTLNPKQGRVIVFAVAHLGVDLRQLTPESFRADGTGAVVMLPPVQVSIELLPAETEVIDSNLDSSQTMALLERAKIAFAADVRNNAQLQRRAVVSTHRAITELLYNAGFTQVTFVDTAQSGS